MKKIRQADCYGKNIFFHLLNNLIELDETPGLLKLNPDKVDPDHSEIFLQINGITLLTGKTGEGKSKLALRIIAGLLSENSNLFQKETKGKKVRIQYYDTEMSINNIKNYLIKCALHDFSSSDLQNICSENLLQVIPLETFSSDEMMSIIKNEVEKFKKDYPDDILVILIDNMNALTDDINSSNNNKLVNDLKVFTSGTTRIIISHVNQKQENRHTAGSMGTALEKVADIHLHVQKKGKDYVVTVQKTRNNPYHDKDKHIVFKEENIDESTLAITDVEIDTEKTPKKKLNNVDKAFDLIKDLFEGKNLRHESRLKKNVVEYLINQLGVVKASAYDYIRVLKEAGKLKEGSSNYLQLAENDLPF